MLKCVVLLCCVSDDQYSIACVCVSVYVELQQLGLA
jgi:hypothetical protein